MAILEAEISKEGIDRNIFKNLRIRYIIGLSAIALTVIISYFMVSGNLKEQLHDSRVLNLAGRQRMLSQKTTKLSLLIERTKDSVSKRELCGELDRTLYTWAISYNGLRFGSDSLGLPHWKSKVIDSMYENINCHFEKVIANSRIILSETLNQKPNNKIEISAIVDSILAHESKFLMGMEQIVFQYDKESRTKVNKLIKVEQLLLGTSLLILLLEFLFIFTPVAIHIRKIIAELLKSESKEKQMNAELRKLNQEIEQSQKELDSIYFAVDQVIMFARTDMLGNVLFISDKFIEHLGLALPETQPNLFELLHCSEQTQPSFEAILQNAISGKMWKNEIQVLNSPQNKFVWLNMTVVPVPNTTNKTGQLVVVCVDIDDRKIAEALLQKATKEKYKRKVAQEKIKASFMLEGQEKERRRIGRELHDGVGQMLTGLKFQMESIDRLNDAKNLTKIEYIKDLTRDIIRETRRVSYNLTPSGLSDYGFVPALNILVNDIKEITNAQINFENITGFDKRLDKKIEMNLFRIIQEALNNALKYSKAENILISLAHEKKKLIVVIEDDGIGFNLNNVMLKDVNKMTHFGILNMKERAGFIKANLDIDTSPGAGTVIKIEMHL